jgi:hypothetical protein
VLASTRDVIVPLQQRLAGDAASGAALGTSTRDCLGVLVVNASYYGTQQTPSLGHSWPQEKNGWEGNRRSRWDYSLSSGELGSQ